MPRLNSLIGCIAAAALSLVTPVVLAQPASAARALHEGMALSERAISDVIQREVEHASRRGALPISHAALVRAVQVRLQAEQQRRPPSDRAGEQVADVIRAVHLVLAEASAREAALRTPRPPAAVSPGIAGHASAIPSGERQALLDLYTSTNGAGWTHNTNWNGAPGTECTWFGVICDAGQTTVQSLNLSSNHLSGSIPTSLGNLTNLVWLFLSSNQLTGSIPTELGNLTYIEGLSLSSNQLTGSIPASLGNLTKLVWLFLSSNQLTGPIPNSLGNLTSLWQLHLSSNQLSGSIPTEFGNLTNLQEFYLSSNLFTGSIPTSLGNLAHLQSLDLSSNLLTGSIPTEVGNLTNLTNLRLNSNQLTGSIPTELGNLRNLRSLVLHSNQLMGSIPTSLGNLRNLQLLSLSSNQLTGSIPTSLANLAKLYYLHLESNQLTGSIPAELGSLTYIEGLSLSSNQLTGSIPASLGNLTKLVWLFLSSNQLTGPIPNSLGNLTSLWQLYLSSNQLAGSIPTEVGNLTNLFDGESDFRWNGLYSNNAGLIAFLNAKQLGGDWQGTQTIAPTGPAASPGATNAALDFTWTPITYTGDTGGYHVFSSLTSGGPYSLLGSTSDKSASSFSATGLNPGTTYYFQIRTSTDPHGNNQNTVTSDPTAEFSASTAAALLIPTSSPLPPGMLNEPYSQQLAASGGTQPYTFSVARGSPPLGVTLSAAGLLAGTPTQSGSFMFTVTVVDNVGNVGSKLFSFEVQRLESIPLLGGQGLALLGFALALAGALAIRRLG